MQLDNISIVCTNKQFQNKVAPLLHSYGAIWQSGTPITQSLGISTDNNLYRVRNNRVSFSPNGASRYQDYLTCKEFLKQYTPLTNEKIFTKFLKSQRKYTWLKRNTLPLDLQLHYSFDQVPVANPFEHIVTRSVYARYVTVVLINKWRKVVEAFNLTGTIDLSSLMLK
jgi:hypothetical protein